MDVTGGMSQAITEGIAQLKTMIPADLTQVHDGLADLESKLQSAMAADIAALVAAGQQLLGAPSVAALGQQLIAALITGKQLAIYPPGASTYPFRICMEDAGKDPSGLPARP